MRIISSLLFFSCAFLFCCLTFSVPLFRWLEDDGSCVCFFVFSLFSLSLVPLRCGNNKSLFWNYLQSASPAPKVEKPPDNMSSLTVDAMRVVRLVSIAGLKPQTFKSWAD